LQAWIIVTIAAIGMYAVMVGIRAVFRVEERQKRMMERSKKLRENPEALTEEELAEHMKEMYVVMGVSFLSLIFFLPIYYVIRARYGIIETPLGKMSWIWWYVIVSVVLGLIYGGVKKWLAQSKGT
jgi:hypothetical protein